MDSQMINNLNSNTYSNEKNNTNNTDLISDKQNESLIPKEAYLYFPSETEQIIFDFKKPLKTIRKIFENVNYNEYEREKLQGFRKFLQEGKELSHIKESEILKFLQANEYDYEKTQTSLKNSVDWSNKTIPVKLNENITRILNSGFIYIHGRDDRFRPLIICNPRFYDSNLYTYEDWLNSVVFLIEYCISNLMLPGQVENWNIICDLKDISLYSVPKELKSIMKTVQDNYKCRLHQMYIINLGSFASILLYLIKKILGESIEKKLKLVSSPETLFENINRFQIEKVMGGQSECSHKNILFPPCMPMLILKENDPQLVCEEKYFNIFGEKYNYVKSPYIKDRLSINIPGAIIYDGEEFHTARDNLSLETITKTEYIAVPSFESNRNPGNDGACQLTKRDNKEDNKPATRSVSPHSEFEIFIDTEKKNFCASCSCNKLCVIF
jgi:hypothetical protein